jgi:P4 family phage/plasmid primase-like protien
MSLSDACAAWRDIQWRYHRLAFKAFGADVIPITAADGTVVPGSRLQQESMGKAPGMFDAGMNAWTGFGKWQTLAADQEWVDRWAGWPGCNVGLHTRHVIAVDVDVDDAEAAARIKAVLVAQLGPPLWRVRSNSARFAALYRVAVTDLPAIGKRVFRLTHRPTNTALGKVEWLTKGQQIVIEGVHPTSGRVTLKLPTTLPDESALDRTPADQLLPSCIDDDLDARVEAVAEALRGLEPDWQVDYHPPTGVSGKRKAVADTSLHCQDPGQLEEALHCVDVDALDYDAWWKMICGCVGATAGDDLFLEAVFIPWCEGSIRWNNEPDYVRGKWADACAKGVTLGADYVDMVARGHGWKGPPLGRPFSLTAAPEADGTAAAPATSGDRDGVAADLNAAEGFVLTQAAMDYQWAPWAPGHGWLYWDSGRWQASDRAYAALRPAVARYLRRVYGAKHAMTGKAQSVMALCQHDLGTGEVDTFDADPWLLGTPAGTVDLHTGRLRAASRDDRITHLTRVAPDEPARCGLWDQCLLDWADGRPELAKALLWALASSLLGWPVEKRFYNLYGPAADNGKSTLCNAMVWLMGDYGWSAARNLLQRDTRATSHRPELLRLRGKRFIVIPEPQETRLDAVLLKAMTGGDLITARTHAKEDISFRCGTLFMTTNDRLHPDKVDAGWIRRATVIPFDATFELDDTLQDRLRRQAGAFLGKLIATVAQTGGKAWLADEVADASAAAVADIDPKRRLLAQVLDFTGDPGDVLTWDEILPAVRAVDTDHELDLGFSDLSAIRVLHGTLAVMSLHKSRPREAAGRKHVFRGVRLKDNGWLA